MSPKPKVMRVQRQPKGGPGGKTYYRLRLPGNMGGPYAEEYGEERWLSVEAPNRLSIGPWRRGCLPVRLLDVRERRGGYSYSHFRQVMLPPVLYGNLGGGEKVEVSQEGETLLLLFARGIFRDEPGAPGVPRDARGGRAPRG